MSEQNRNMVLFMVLSLGLMGIYYWMVGRPQPGRPAPAAQVQQATPAVATPTPATTPAATPAASPLPSTQPAVDPTRTLTVENPELKLTWRVQDGALVQVTWKKDNTAFFPVEERGPKGEEISGAFPGLGAVLGTRFEGEPELKPVSGGRELSFRTEAGDRLVYRIPDQGHVLEMTWNSPSGKQVYFLPKPVELKHVHNLGRIFTLQEKSIDAVAWTDMLKDPFFSFLGAKRKTLPREASRLGMDAGVEKGQSAQTNHFFAAIWEISRMPERDLGALAGYHAGPDAQGVLKARLYLGPKQAEALVAFGPAYRQVLDFGFFGLVAQFMFWILRLIQSVIPNWGWTLIVFSIIIRGAMWPLNNKTTVSMLRMKELEPHQKALQAKYEKFGNDMQKKAEMQKELMAFYKKNGHNPMGGCLPMLLQMPVFMALWSMLGAVFELRGAPFAFWLQNLSVKDPYFILPILLGVSMLAQSAMTPATGDPMQRKMMMWMMPAMMVFFFAQTPAGLCLYYLVFNLIGLLQTWWVMKTYQPQPVVL